MRAIMTICTFIGIFTLGFFTSNVLNDLRASETSISLLKRYKTKYPRKNKDTKKLVEKNAEKSKNSKMKASHKSLKQNETKEDLVIVDIMRNEVDLTDKEKFNKYINYTSKLVHKKIVGTDTRTVVIGTDVFQTISFEGGEVETKIDEKGNKHWDKVKYDNGLEVYKGYDHFQKIDRTISSFDGKRVSYTSYSPKNGEVKERWVHLQNGDLLYSKYVDGINTTFWKLPDGGDVVKDWVRAL